MAATSAIELAQRDVEELAEAGGAVLGRDVRTSCTALSGQALAVGEGAKDRVGELLLRPAGGDVPAAGVTDELLRAARRRDDRGDAARERLSDGDPEALLSRGHHEQRALTQERR